jgi:hypothetical protein
VHDQAARLALFEVLNSLLKNIEISGWSLEGATSAAKAGSKIMHFRSV